MSHAGRRIIASLVVVMCLSATYSVLWLAAWVSVPSLITDLSPRVLISGSMGPGLDRGDIVLAGPAAPDDLVPGRVVTFRDPINPQQRITHRIVDMHDDGSLRTKGDANAVADSTPIGPEQVTGVVRLAVPTLGLPLVWVRDGQAWLAAIALAAVVVAFLGARAVTRGPRPHGTDPGHIPGDDSTTGPPAIHHRLTQWAAAGATWVRSGLARRLPLGRRVISRWLRTAATGMTLSLAAALVLSVTPTHAGFFDTTASPSNSWSAATSFGCSSPSTETLLSVSDTLVAEAYPDSNFGTSTSYGIRSSSSGDVRSLVSMDLPAIPAGCVVTGATLRLYTSSGVTGRTLETFQVDTSWTETGVTWNTQPATTGTAATAASVSSGWVEWGVTSIVDAMYAGSNHGFLLRDASEGSSTTLDQSMHSRESTNVPELVITFGDPPTAPDAPTDLTATAASSSQIDLAWTDTSSNEDGFKIERSPGGQQTWSEIAQVGADVTTHADTGLAEQTTYDYRVRAFNGVGDSAYSNVASATTPEQTCTTSTQTVLSVSDTLVLEAYPDTNFGTSSSYYGVRSSSSGDGRSLVSMDLPAIPAGCVVTDATLRLYTSSGVTGRTLEAFQVDASWTETGVTWNTQPATTGTAATAASVSSGWVEWGVTSIVDAMYAGSNHGFLLRDATENSSTTQDQSMHARENTNVPELVITFG